MNALKIYFRRHQLIDIETGQKVLIQCGDIATYIPGMVDQSWQEFTEFTEMDGSEGLDQFQSTWDAVNQGSSTNAAGSNYDKGLSASLTFWGDAFSFIWNWLMANECQTLNSIDVKITDALCNKSFRLFEIKADNLKYRPEDNCRIDVQLREQDLTWHCIHKTFIWDDHNGFATTKDHPTFLTCIEPRPRLMNSVRLALMLFYQSNPAKGAIDWFTGADILDDGRRILNLETWTPAPLIRDYIDNVAAKCGLSVDTLFHRVGTPEYNACIFHPLAGQMYQNDGNDEVAPSMKFIFENRWNITLAELLDKLRVPYGSEWYVTPGNTIVFKPIQELIDVSPIADMTDGTFPIRDLEYTFSGEKKPAYGRYQYQPDGSDLGSQEISPLYNDLTDFDGPSNNPMLEGELNKPVEFAPTAFVRDGRTKDYINLLIEDGVIGAYIIIGILAVIAGAGIAGTLSVGMGIALIGIAAVWANNIRNKRIELRRRFVYQEPNTYTGAVRLVTADQTMMPRILIWDGVKMDRAKVIKTGLPAPAPYYNPDATPYNLNNKIAQDNPTLSLYNYPVYFDSKYQYNLFDRFHDSIDNPLKSLETNQTFEFETDLCCDAMNLFGLWENDFVKIGYLLLIERRANYNVYGRIKNIAVSYEDYTIKVKGKVIRRAAINVPVQPGAPTPGTPEVETQFEYWFGYTDLDPATSPDEAAYVASIALGTRLTSYADLGGNVSAFFFAPGPKVLYIEVPGTELPFTKWSIEGDPGLQDQPIDATFAGSEVFFTTTRGANAVYMTRGLEEFGGRVILSR